VFPDTLATTRFLNGLSCSFARNNEGPSMSRSIVYS
jgi:hypothetical protein